MPTRGRSTRKLGGGKYHALRDTFCLDDEEYDTSLDASTTSDSEPGAQGTSHAQEAWCRPLTLHSWTSTAQSDIEGVGHTVHSIPVCRTDGPLPQSGTSYRVVTKEHRNVRQKQHPRPSRYPVKRSDTQCRYSTHTRSSNRKCEEQSILPLAQTEAGAEDETEIEDAAKTAGSRGEKTSLGGMVGEDDETVVVVEEEEEDATLHLQLHHAVCISTCGGSLHELESEPLNSPLSPQMSLQPVVVVPVSSGVCNLLPHYERLTSKDLLTRYVRVPSVPWTVLWAYATGALLTASLWALPSTTNQSHHRTRWRALVGSLHVLFLGYWCYVRRVRCVPFGREADARLHSSFAPYRISTRVLSVTNSQAGTHANRPFHFVPIVPPSTKQRPDETCPVFRPRAIPGATSSGRDSYSPSLLQAPLREYTRAHYNGKAIVIDLVVPFELQHRMQQECNVHHLSFTEGTMDASRNTRCHHSRSTKLVNGESPVEHAAQRTPHCFTPLSQDVPRVITADLLHHVGLSAGLDWHQVRRVLFRTRATKCSTAFSLRTYRKLMQQQRTSWYTNHYPVTWPYAVDEWPNDPQTGVLPSCEEEDRTRYKTPVGEAHALNRNPPSRLLHPRWSAGFGTVHRCNSMSWHYLSGKRMKCPLQPDVSRIEMCPTAARLLPFSTHTATLFSTGQGMHPDPWQHPTNFTLDDLVPFTTAQYPLPSPCPSRFYQTGTLGPHEKNQSLASRHSATNQTGRSSPNHETMWASLCSKRTAHAAYLDPSAAHFLASLGSLRLVGIDSPTVGTPSGTVYDDDVRNILYRSEIAMLENLDLSQLSDYFHTSSILRGTVLTIFPPQQIYRDAMGAVVNFYPEPRAVAKLMDEAVELC